jgi:hypothetical protein
MATTPPRMRTPRIRTTSLVLACIAVCISVLMTAASPAAAASTAANYRLDAMHYGNGVAVGTCRGWGADADAAGNFYAACPAMRDIDGNGSPDVQAPALYEMDSTGKVTRLGWLPAEYAFNDYYPIRDVGVSPDGNTAYISVGPNLDNLGVRPDLNPTTKQPMANGATVGSILRLVRQPDGSWLHDAAFKAGPFIIGNGNYWAIRYVDVDGNGRVYVSVNAYVYELDPTSGTVVSAFGGAVTAFPGGPWVEGFDKPEGLAVSADGNSIYIVDQQHQIVQRWTRVGATDWTRDTSFLLGIPDQVGDYCATTDHFQSPYDVGVDAAGDVYVMDTTCQRIQRFMSTGAFVQTVWTNTGGDDTNHGLAVNWQGSILLPIEEDVLTRLDPPARPAAPAAPAPVVGGGGAAAAAAPCVDAAPPTITAVEAAARTRTRRVKVTVAADDDCGITHVRALGDRLGRGAWVDGSSLVVPLGGWNGRKRLTILARDSAGNLRSRRIVVTMLLPQPKLRARTNVNRFGRSCSSTDPRRRIHGYRLVDRCARISGRVLQVRRTSSGMSLQVLIPVGQARALYTNAVGAVKIWVVADRSTRISGRIRARRAVIVDGSLVAERDRTAVHAVPVDRIAAR